MINIIDDFMEYKMVSEDDLLLEKVVNTIVRENPTSEARPLFNTVYGRHRMLATLLFKWVWAGNQEKMILLKACGLNHEDSIRVDVALEKAIAAERKRREDAGNHRFSVNKFRSDYIESQLRAIR